MTPKRLRLIALLIRKRHPAEPGWTAIAQEIETHATELEMFGWMMEQAEKDAVKLKEPRLTVIGEIVEMAKRRPH